MLGVATLGWGLSFPVIKAALLLHARLEPGAGTWFATLAVVTPRFILAALVMAVWPRGSGGRMTPAEWRQGIVVGLFAAAGMLLQNQGLQTTAASTSAFLTQLYAILIPMWLAARTRRNPGGSVWISCALVLAGVALLGRFDWRTFQFGRGEWETLLSSVFFMGQILWISRPGFAANRPVPFTLAMFATLGTVFAVATAATAPSVEALLLPWTSGPWVVLTLVLTIVCTLGAFLAMNTWQPMISATQAGLIYCIEPIFGSLFALFLPAALSRWCGIAYANEPVTMNLLAGGALITGANALLQLRPPPA
jgi:drug/metabolite transporter (DMT)-like permease